MKHLKEDFFILDISVRLGVGVRRTEVIILNDEVAAWLSPAVQLAKYAYRVLRMEQYYPGKESVPFGCARLT